jgi:arginine utilization protein RocB
MDVTSDQTDGSAGRAIYAGTIGKLLPFALVIGQSSHAAYPFEGISAQMIGAEILRAIEGNTDLADTGPGDVSPPPICLEARDLREGYEVTTPERFWLSFNWLYHAGSPADRFERFCGEVNEALGRATAQFARQAKAFAAKTGTAPGAALSAPRVITVAELKKRILGTSMLKAEFSAFEESLANVDNPLAIGRACTEWLADAAQIKGPAVIAGFTGLHYPPGQFDRNASQDAEFIRAIETARRVLAKDIETSVRWRPFFQGISDMSFLGQPLQDGALIISENTPAARLIDTPAGQPLEFPVVNIGPWGREYHQRLERVYAPYAFESLPRFLAAIVDEFLVSKADGISGTNSH